MLGNQKLKVIIPTLNAKKAKEFYKSVLGLTLLREDDFALDFDANGTVLRITIVNELNPQPFTIIGWDVKDIESVVETLTNKNIVFEQYDCFDQDDLGIWTAPSGAKIAWFKDYDGNILSLSEEG